MSMIEIVLSIGIKLFVAVFVTVLINKLKYFKNLGKSGGKILIITGIWIYSLFSIPILKLKFVMYLGGMSLFDYVAYIGLILGIIGLVLCIVSNNEKNSEIIEKIMKQKNEQSKTNTDDINLF